MLSRHAAKYLLDPFRPALSSTFAFSHNTMCETVEIGLTLRIIFKCRVESAMFKN